MSLELGRNTAPTWLMGLAYPHRAWVPAPLFHRSYGGPGLPLSLELSLRLFLG